MSRGRVGVFIGCLLLPTIAPAAVLIEDDDFYSITTNEQGSGNGVLDLLLFTTGVSENKTGGGPSGFNADNANTAMPSGNTASAAAGSYITSIGELRDFYILNFPVTGDPNASTVSEIALFVDLNETGSINDISLDDLRIVIDYDQIGAANDDRNDPAGTDISSATQNLTGSSFTGGTLLAELGTSPKVLPLNNQGGGWADHVIFTSINPFDNAFTDSTRILFYWESTDHDSGSETIFLSGEVSPQDVIHSVPEPSAIALLVLGAGMLARRRRS